MMLPVLSRAEDCPADPKQEIVDTFSAGPGSHERAQTFTVGTAGQLLGIEFYGNQGTGGADVLTIDIRPTVGGVPGEDNGDVLVSRSVLLSSLPAASGWIPIDFSTDGISLEGGENLALVLRVSGGLANWFGDSFDPYAGGESFTRPVGNPSWVNLGGPDYGFRVYVCPWSCPEDQEQEIVDTFSAGPGSHERAQTFTVGVTGQLVGIEFYGNQGTGGADVLTVDVRPTAGGVPGEDNGDVLASKSVALSALPATSQWIPIHFAGDGVSVEAGEKLALVLRVSGGLANWFGDSSDPYAGGGAFTRPVGNPSWVNLGGPDYGFRIYVCPWPCPADQEQEIVDTFSGGPGSHERAQTFTVGVTGQLVGIEFYGNQGTGGADVLTVDVRPTAGGVPGEDNGDVLASRSFVLSALPAVSKWVPVDFSGDDLSVVEGEEFALVLRVSGGLANWFGDSSDPYAGGGAFTRPVGNPSWVSLGDPDYGFRVVVCDAAAAGDAWSEPQARILRPAGPNPVRGKLTYGIRLDGAADLQVSLFDVRGRLIARLLDGGLPAGEHSFTWHPEPESGRAPTTGVYFLRLDTDGVTETQKVMIVK